MEKSSIRTLTVLGLIVTGAGVIAPILWDRYKSTESLQLHELGEAALLEGSTEIKKLKVLYDNKPIAKLTRFDFAFVNAGRTPFLAADIIDPPKLHFRWSEVLDVHVSSTEPEGIELKPTVDKQKSVVRLPFVLLNPSDVVRFSVIAAETDVPESVEMLRATYAVSGRKPRDYSITARITGLPRIEIVDKRTSLDRQPLEGWFYILGGFTLLLIAISISGMNDIRHAHLIANAAKTGLLAVPINANKVEIEAAIKTTLREMRWLQGYKAALLKLAAIPPSNGLDAAQRTAVLQDIQSAAEEVLKTKPILWVFGVLASIGFMYIVYTLLRL